MTCGCPRSEHPHGALQRYLRHKCRCALCRAEHAARARARRRRHAYGTSIPVSVPVTGTARRVEALACLGWSAEVLAVRIDIAACRLSRIIRNQAGISPANAKKVADLYDELWNQEPPTTNKAERISASRSKALAARRGWLPPLAWDDIDHDPEPPTGETVGLDEIAIERAIMGSPVTLTRAERLEAIRIMHSRGIDDSEIGRRLNTTGTAICHTRKRRGIAA